MPLARLSTWRTLDRGTVGAHMQRGRGLRALPVALLAALWCATALGQPPPGQPPPAQRSLEELSLEELMDVRVETVQGASRFEQKVTEAPALVTIVSGDQIRRLGHRTLADVLRSVGGLYVSDDRNYMRLGVRGFARPGDYNTRILLLVDGHRINGKHSSRPPPAQRKS